MVKICAYCGKEFEAKRAIKKYCSDKCKHRSYYKKHRKKLKIERRERWAREAMERRIERTGDDIGLSESLCEFSCFECPYDDCIMP